MRILKLTSLLMVAVLATAVLFTSCVKKPKLDLSGVQGNPGGNGAGEAGELGELANGGLDGVGDEGFVPGGEPGFDGVVDPFAADGLNGADGRNGADGLDGADGQNGADVEKGGAWAGTDAPLAEADGSGFIKNSQRWNDCVIYFAYDQYEVGAAERSKLDALAKYLSENPTLGVIVEGHTDERGSDEYNRALGERRALAVTQYLGLMGVDASRCKTISYGEDKPAKSPATTEAEHQLNRRAEFLIGDL